MDSNGEYETEAETMALHRARSSFEELESSDSEPEGRPQARPAAATYPPPKAQGPSQATSEGLGKSPRLPQASGVIGIPIPWPLKVAAAESFPVIHADVAHAAPATPAFDGPGVMPSPLASLSATTSLPELVKEFGQIVTKLRSTRRPYEPQHLQDQRRIFREWMQRDFSAFFSLKALQDAEIALTKLYQAHQMTKVQYESFISFFENLRALRDQHLKAERQANRVRCYKEKHTRTSTTLQQLVEEGSSMEDRIIVVVAEIQKLEEQLSALKAEQMTLSSKLYKKMEEVKKVNHEVEESEAQLANNNIALEEPGCIFTIMQTYHSRIAALAKDVNLLI
ncbi:uncharacterized protein LOC103944450 [Pyrus x bretschneideri]|uniref:uncharacterized protein LOC103944450 n=1 Tax=Pyrus x bretschneideri TaxID=225117 RepID=UPI00202ED806|nr:uncharacterized protein LOC103944450 [Pyrus x bretschneideri]